MAGPAISLQLYSVRSALERDLRGTLQRLAAIGLSTVEVFDFVRRVDELAQACTDAGLTATTGHAPLASDTLTAPSGEVLALPSNAEVFSAAAALGLGVVIDPYTEPSRWRTRDGIEDVAMRLNHAAAAAAEHGLRVGYHNHWQEVGTAVDGRYGLEVLADVLDPSVVLEVDLYWATVGGVDDVPGLVDRLGGRVVAVHVKDGTLEPEKTKLMPPTDQVVAGHGRVALAGALDCARSLEYAVIEFDAVPGDVFDAIAGTHRFLADRGMR